MVAQGLGRRVGKGGVPRVRVRSAGPQAPRHNGPFLEGGEVLAVGGACAGVAVDVADGVGGEDALGFGLPV